MDMRTFQEEKFIDIVEEIKPLLFQHWKELANHQDDRPLDPDYDTYTKLNEMGVLKIFVVRENGKIIGYASFIVANHLHYRTWRYALCDVYYLDPSRRNTGLGFKMFEEIRKWLQSYGVKSITVQDKINHSHTSLFLKLGFSLIEQNYELVL